MQQLCTLPFKIHDLFTHNNHFSTSPLSYDNVFLFRFASLHWLIVVRNHIQMSALSRVPIVFWDKDSSFFHKFRLALSQTRYLASFFLEKRSRTPLLLITLWEFDVPVISGLWGRWEKSTYSKGCHLLFNDFPRHLTSNNWATPIGVLRRLDPSFGRNSPYVLKCDDVLRLVRRTPPTSYP